MLPVSVPHHPPVSRFLWIYRNGNTTPLLYSTPEQVILWWILARAFEKSATQYAPQLDIYTNKNKIFGEGGLADGVVEKGKGKKKPLLKWNRTRCWADGKLYTRTTRAPRNFHVRYGGEKGRNNRNY